MSRQNEELARVSKIIGAAIIEYKLKLGTGIHFHCEALRQYVIAKHPEIAPDSPSRVLRSLRQKGKLDYRVVNRSASLYEFTA
jgi:hypothetical protein